MANKEGPYYDTPLAFRGQPSIRQKAAAFRKADKEHAASRAQDFDGLCHMQKMDSKDPSYGRPVEGSKTEFRGRLAGVRISGEIVDLCIVIRDLGERLSDNTYVISFGLLFQAYTKISNKLVGMLLRARKQGLVEFEGEMLFQRRDDDVQIHLLKDPSELEEDLQKRKDVLKDHPGNIKMQGHSSLK